jgi:pyruvate formate lyase activating enzyme
MSAAGLVTDIKHFATHDGPGIRTTVFLKGCPLRCFWCSNPAGFEPRLELAFTAERCLRCGLCSTMCPEGALDLDRADRIDRARCNLCFECVRACPQGAFQRVGREMSVEAIVAEVEKDRPFYGADGGVSLCGGEPLLQAELAIGVLRECRARGITTVLDTSGYAPREIVEEAMRWTDLVLLDIKHTDPAAHRRGTGVDLDLILQNAALMCRSTRVRISLPLVPGFNDSRENLEATARLARSLGVGQVDLLPLHALGLHRYPALGRTAPFDPSCVPSADSVRDAQRIIEALGVEVTLGRMM